MFVRGALFGPRVALGLVLLGGSIALGLASGAASSSRARAVGLEPTSVTAISAGEDHTCALFAGGTIKCWGSNGGQLGNNALRNQTGSPTPVEISGITNATQVSAGRGHTCAVLSGGTVKCWGANEWGQLGTGGTTASAIPSAVIGITNAIQVSAGYEHTCAVLSDGKIKCWGNGGNGQLGDGHEYSTPVGDGWSLPVEVSGVTNAKQVSVGYEHTCAVLIDGKIKCWGSMNGPTPVPVTDITDAVQISAGSGHTCALLSGGTIKCWGDGASGQLGTGGTKASAIPVAVIGITNAIQVSAGGFHTCALLSDSTVKCWGENYFGELGDGSNGDSWTPVQVEGVSNAIQVSAGGYSTCALSSAGTVKCWGRNDSGQLGNGKQGNAMPPVEVSGITNAKQVSAGDGNTCAVLSDGKLKCWGNNYSGQLGNGTTTPSSTPVEVSGIRKAVAVSAIGGDDQLGHLEYQTCAILAGGALRCWGHGPLGNGKLAKVSSSVPVAVRGIKKATAISGNYGFDRIQRCVVLRGGTIECWGFGQRVPVAVHGIRNAVSVSVGDLEGSFCALLRDGKIECRQARHKDQGITNARIISSGAFHTCVVLSSGKVKCWGDNVSGQLGNGKRTSHGLPVTARGIKDATAVSASDDYFDDIENGAEGFTCAVLRSGRIKCWGEKGSGQLGNLAAHYGHYGLEERSLTPVQVSGITNATQVSAGNRHACALLSDGRVKCWGDNSYGQLGDGGTDANPTPVDVIGLS